MSPDYIVYDDGEIAVGLFTEDARGYECLLHLGFRWLCPKSLVGRDGELVERPNANLMGGETQWILVPYTFGYAIGRTLVEQKVAGGLAECFDEEGFAKMVELLVDHEELADGMCY